MTRIINRRSTDEDVRLTVNQLVNGKHNAVGSFTLDTGSTTTVVTDARAGANTVVCWQPTTANAAAEIGAGGMFVSANGEGSFTVTHANNAQSDRTFQYSLHS